MKIDCHTHIINKKIADEYFSRTDGYALVMQMSERLMHAPDAAETVKNNDRLFLCPVIDLKDSIWQRLAEIEEHIDDRKVVGLKIFLSYQTANADDKRLYPIYEFASEYRLGVTFHTGTCSLVLPSDNYFEGSDAERIGRVCEDFPDVGFVAAHMDDPRLLECIKVASEHENFFTDFSGLYEPGYKEDDNIEEAIKVYKQAIESQPHMEDHILYGTDFCPPINLCKIDEYEYTVNSIFKEEDRNKIYFENALRAFPRLRLQLAEFNK